MFTKLDQLTQWIICQITYSRRATNCAGNDNLPFLKINYTMGFWGFGVLGFWGLRIDNNVLAEDGELCQVIPLTVHLNFF